MTLTLARQVYFIPETVTSCRALSISQEGDFDVDLCTAGGSEGELGSDMDLGGGDGEGGGLLSQLWDVFSNND